MIVEWDNARISEAWRARSMLRQLAAQLLDLAPGLPARPEVLVLCDDHEIAEGTVKAALAEAFEAHGWGAAMPPGSADDCSGQGRGCKVAQSAVRGSVNGLGAAAAVDWNPIGTR